MRINKLLNEKLDKYTVGFILNFMIEDDVKGIRKSMMRGNGVVVVSLADALHRPSADQPMGAILYLLHVRTSYLFMLHGRR